MAPLKRFERNRPEYGIYMNKLAFGGTAIDTVGFPMRFPIVAPEASVHKDYGIDRLPADLNLLTIPVFMGGYHFHD